MHRSTMVGVMLLAVHAPIVRSQATRSSGPALHFIAGAIVQNWQNFSNISMLGVAGGVGLDVPLRSRLSLRGDVSVAYFGHSLLSDEVVDCIQACSEPTSHSSDVSGALDIVRRVGDRLYLIAGASAHRSIEVVDRGHRDAVAIDVGTGMDVSANWRLETVLQKLSRPVGRTQWMLPVRFRLRL